jgi:phospholipid/cholesterol/gamma-HCH transport system substrate-binding protein
VRSASNAPRPGGGATGTATPSAESTTTFGYDPVTGLVVGSDGAAVQFGGTGGQYQLAGDRSWKQLLLAGLAS